MDPGPVDPSVLRLQAQHRSQAIWDGASDTLLQCREHKTSTFDDWEPDERIISYISRIGLYGVHRLHRSGVTLDRALITALVERWRQETHTFHLPVGEATLTLQDVAVLYGLPIDGYAVSEPPPQTTWMEVVQELLGITPDVDGEEPEMSGSTLRLKCLTDYFAVLPEAADADRILRFSRAYAMYLFGTILFPDKSGGSVQLIFLPLLRDWERAGQYSWGSAALASLYRNMCRAAKKGAKEIAGPLLLLQIWSWERIQVGRPYVTACRGQPEQEDDGAPLGSQHRRGIDPVACRFVILVLQLTIFIVTYHYSLMSYKCYA